MDYSSGSIWRKWDLHVHTPASIVQNYGKDTDTTWEKFLINIETLPQEIKVLGVHDYLFIDGYIRLLEEKSKGRLPNIDLLLPVIELRLDKFGGSKGKLSKVNFHILFSNEVKPSIIQQHFINALQHVNFQITPKYKEELQGEWSGIITRESLIELGSKIINSFPESEKDKYHSPIIEGFNNINFSLEAILEILDRSYFKDRTMTAVGKTEWADVKWNDQSIAAKKDIINKADIVFIASEKTSDYYKAKVKLTESKVNDRLLDCSDAHDFSNSAIKDRLGNCFTWIKADPALFVTFVCFVFHPPKFATCHVPTPKILPTGHCPLVIFFRWLPQLP